MVKITIIFCKTTLNGEHVFFFDYRNNINQFSILCLVKYSLLTLSICFCFAKKQEKLMHKKKI